MKKRFVYLVLTIAGMFSGGFAVYQCWTQFLVPLGAPVIGFAHAIGMSLALFTAMIQTGTVGLLLGLGITKEHGRDEIGLRLAMVLVEVTIGLLAMLVGLFV